MNRLSPTDYATALARKNAREAQKARGSKFRAPLNCRQPLKRGVAGRLKPGKKTKEWASVRAKLKVRFAAVGITSCELLGILPHLCTKDNYLGFAHAAKRRKLSSDDLYHVILICNHSHNIIEVWPAEEMKRIVDSTIHQREKQP